MADQFTLDRIEAAKKQLIAYEEAALAITQGGAQSYKIDTGQSAQSVTKLDIPDMEKTYDLVYNRLIMLETRAGVILSTGLARPAW